MLFRSLTVLVAFLSPGLALAHGGADGGGLVHGLMHPLSGLDHVLAMVAVGVFAAQLGGRATWAVPAAFAGMMAVGGLMGAVGVGLPWVEAAIGLSVLALGLLVAGGVRMPVAAAMALVGAFAVFHGHAHGMEMPAGAGALQYGIGFIAGTAALHAVGLALGLATGPRMARLAGAGTALAGLGLAIVAL